MPRPKEEDKYVSMTEERIPPAAHVTSQSYELNVEMHVQIHKHIHARILRMMEYCMP